MNDKVVGAWLLYGALWWRRLLIALVVVLCAVITCSLLAAPPLWALVVAAAPFVVWLVHDLVAPESWMRHLAGEDRRGHTRLLR